MKIAIIYNRDSQAVINLFGIPNREKYGLETVERIKNALEQGGIRSKRLKVIKILWPSWKSLCRR